MLKELKEFAIRGSVVDMAVGIIIGAAFGAIVKSLVSDIILPPVGVLLGNVDFADLFVVLREGGIAGPYGSLEGARQAGAVTVNYGVFANTVVNFVIVACAVFLLIRGINRLKRPKEQGAPPVLPTRECPYCLSAIPLKATRCAHCIADLKVPSRT